MEIEKVALSLLSGKNCQNCNVTCFERSKQGVCEKWSSKNDFEKNLNLAVKTIQNNISKGSPNYLYSNPQTFKLIETSIKKELQNFLPNSMYNILVTSNDDKINIDITVKKSVSAEYININIQVKK